MRQISIVGLSGAGKTCYIYAMSKTMMRGVNNISINPIDDNLYNQLRAGWRNIKTERKWPTGTDRVNRCEFTCFVQLRPVMDFCWDDYKGGSLTGFDTISAKEREEFYKSLSISDGVIFCVPADTIIEALEGDDDAQDDINMLNRFILQYASKNSLKGIPITVAITKSDLLDKEELSIAFQVVKKTLNNLFAKGTNVSVLLVPISLGSNLKGLPGGEITGTINMDPKAGNIHLPVLFNLYYMLLEQISEFSTNLKELRLNLSSVNSSIYFGQNMNGLKRWWEGVDIDNLQKNKSDLQRIIEQKEEELRGIETDLKKIKNEFGTECEYYFNGEIIKF